VGIAALICWIITATVGIYMLLVWLIENDPNFPGAAPTRLPAVVVFGHALLAVTGLGLWTAFLFTGIGTLAWATVGVLLTLASLGAALFSRWITVYRTADAVPVSAVSIPGLADVRSGQPAEQNFPVAVVAAHGVFASVTFTLVLLAALGIGVTA
jgi:hypothetical protein